MTDARVSNKPSVYNKRTLSSIPAPLESDSDPDFNPGAYVYEPTKKAKSSQRRGPKAPQTSSVGPQDLSELSKPKRKRISREQLQSLHNPLLEYFRDLELQSASEEEQQPEDPQEVETDEDDEPEDESPHSSDDSSVKRNTRAGFLPPHESDRKQEKSLKPGIAADDSATESDSGVDEPVLSLKRKPSESQLSSTAAKRGKIEEENIDDSGTESDSGPDLSPTADTKQGIEVGSSSQNANRMLMPIYTDSATESDSGAELPADQSLDPRPGFPLSEGQRLLPPLLLDRSQCIMVPAAVNTYLREYQREGIKFFWDKYQQGRGGLLGDDMGLVSKTIQVISFLSAIMRKHGDIRDLDRRRRHVSDLQDSYDWRKRRILPLANAKWPTCLIIAPSTVVYNWKREFDKWGYFEVGMYVGTPTERESVLNDFKMGRLDVVITSFDLARRDIDLLDDLPWSCVFVDEVHRVKNSKSKVTEAYHQFTCQRRFGLTGTAIQNSYLELWTILDWTNPGRLGTSKQWTGFVVRPLTVGQSAGATEDQRATALAVALILKNKLLPDFFLRRTKVIIKEQLPQKFDEVVFCPLSPVQISVYKRILQADAVQNLVHKDDPCTCGSKKKRKSCCHPFVTGDVFKFMSILIKLSNHLALILPAPTDTPEQTIRNRQLAEIAFLDEEIPKYGTAMLQPKFCGKWEVLEMLLTEWHKDKSNKVLIFTKSVKLLEMLEFHLGKLGYGFLKLDGSTKHSSRMPMIDRFHVDSDIFVFLISTLAGGTGLNLTGANKVVIFDPNWNPAHDLQAMDRAYRFGQTRDVSVYRLLGAGSVEELIYARQLYKQQQMAIGYQASVQTRYFEGVQGDTTKQGELFGIKNIFKLHEHTLATKLAIERASIADLDWALANMAGVKTRKQEKGIANDLGLDIDTKAGKEEPELRGLGALLFDEEPLGLPEEDVIHKTLNAIGVKYSHRNDEILQPNRIEEERARNAVRAKRRRKQEAKTSAGAKAGKQVESPETQWPPKRKHHQPPLKPQDKLLLRQMALIDLGMISSPTDLPVFAQDFSRKSRDEQDEILSMLDDHARKKKKNIYMQL